MGASGSDKPGSGQPVSSNPDPNAVPPLPNRPAAVPPHADPEPEPDPNDNIDWRPGGYIQVDVPKLDEDNLGLPELGL